MNNALAVRKLGERRSRVRLMSGLFKVNGDVQM